jgi:glucose-6-phosphate 1-epimerase
VNGAVPLRVGGLPCVELQAPDGGRAVVSPFGAQVLSWQPHGGDERLFLSPLAALDGSGPIRGGVPVVFPQFANLGPLPAHGLVRHRVWRLDAATAELAAFSLQDDEAGRALWPLAFGLRFTVRLAGPSLWMRLEVTNRSADAFAFQAALHTYLRVHDLAALRLHGLGGAAYRDRADGGRDGRQPGAELALAGDLDRIYPDAPPVLTVHEPRQALQAGLGGGFKDLVVWNPGAERCARVPDLSPDSYQHFVCVEAACIVQPAVLQPGQTWWGEQRLTVMPGLSDGPAPAAAAGRAD